MNLNKIKENFHITKSGSIDSSDSFNSIESYQPFFLFIEEYCEKNGAQTKWVDENLIVYSKDFNELNRDRAELSESYAPFITVTYSDEEDCYDTVSFEFNINQIDSFDKMITELDTIINHKQSPDCYFTNEEIEEREARNVIRRIETKKDIETSRIFQEKLSILRISEDEFLDLLSSYKQ